MRHIVRKSAALAFVALSCAQAQALTYAPDPNFRAWVNMNYPGSVSGDFIDETNPGIVATTYVNVSGQGIADLQGIEAFWNITDLSCSYNPITQQPFFPWGLIYLNVSNCALTSLDLSAHGALQDLNCGYNQLASLTLPSWGGSLGMLYCAHNQLSTITTMPNSVYMLDMSYNQFSQWPPLSANMSMVWASHNLFNVLEPIYTINGIYSVDLSYNQIDSMGDISYWNVTSLDLSGNPLTSAGGTLPWRLEQFSFNSTQAACLPYLPESLELLYCTGNSFDCLPNQPALLDMSAANFGFVPVVCASGSGCYTPPPSVDLRAILQGAYVQNTGMMRDDLRAQNLLPLSDPYPAMGFVYAGNGWTDQLDPALFTVTGPDAIVDWVVVDMHVVGTISIFSHNGRHYSRPALVQRDGDVVNLDGTAPVTLNMPRGTYRAAVRHRNHLGAMKRFEDDYTSTPVPVDFGNWMTTTCYPWAMYGDSVQSEPRQFWAGDVTFDHQLEYAGAGNDRDAILQTIGGLVPTTVVSGVYSNSDVNLDGKVKYTGVNNDRDPILVNIGGNNPLLTRNQIAFQ